MSVVRSVRCACGSFEARGTDDELVRLVQRHGREVHNMEATREQVLAMAVEVETPAAGLDGRRG